MKFTEEDKIITVKEARDRSKLGQEDSAVREGIRGIMIAIGDRSYYGYRIIRHCVRLKSDKEFKKITKEVEKLGFKIKLQNTDKTNLPNKYNYAVDVEW